MNKPRLVKALFVSLLILMPTLSIPLSQAQSTTLSPPPTPPYILTTLKMNQITYVIKVRNIDATSVTIDFALPRTWTPDTYVKITDIKIDGATFVYSNMTDRENNRTRVTNTDFQPGETVAINVTFYEAKYKLEYTTEQPTATLGYPAEYAIYTQPENYIESNNTLIIAKALALIRNNTNPFYIAEKMYNFALSYITYIPQKGIRGALWALQNGTGDCTEFGTLFVALMRAVGIPARTVIGHVARELADGGTANASSLGWVRSPHLWAEFYVEGYGWVPVDPTFGRRNPVRHFGICWANYLPMIKGPTMVDPSDTLVEVRHPPDTKVEYESYLLVSPLTSLPFEDKSIQDFVAANDVGNTARRVANQAYHYLFDITSTYPLLARIYSSLGNATRAMENGNLALSSEYSLDASSSANQALNMISSSVVSEATSSVSRAWKEFRILGAIGGEIYLMMARSSQTSGGYKDVVLDAYLAEVTADQAPSFLVFLGPALLCVFTVGMIRRKNGKTKSAKKSSPSIPETG